MTDEQIYSGAIDGDEDALFELFDSTREHVEDTCAYFMGGDDAMPKAVIGTYHRALLFLAKGDAPSLPLRSWLSTLAAQECYAVMLRLRQEHDQQSKKILELTAQISMIVDITEDPVERMQFMTRGGLGGVPEQERPLIAMRELEGLSFLQIAKRLGQSWALTVQQLIRARQSLIRSVKEGFGV